MSRQNPFSGSSYSDEDDHALIAQILNGDQSALDRLVKQHQEYLFNVALKVTNNKTDAEDATQEVLIKVITNLGSFDPDKAKFRTWLYRITVNHILNLKKQKYEQLVTGFGDFFDFIDRTPELDIREEEEQAYHVAIEESKIACMSGMIMCLDRGQRLIYVLGEMFEIDHKLAGEIFDISPANFRKKLSRARKDLYQWMHNRCGLVNTENPCRCPKKTKGFIERGVVDKDGTKWRKDYKAGIFELSASQADEVLNERDRLYARLFKEHPFQKHHRSSDVLGAILSNKTIAENLDLR